MAFHFSTKLPTLVRYRNRYRLWRPDFTLPYHNDLIVEYAGMPDRPDYMEGIRHKQIAYRDNHLPARASSIPKT